MDTHASAPPPRRVRLTVASIERSLEFYCGLLGCTLEQDSTDAATRREITVIAADGLSIRLLTATTPSPPTTPVTANQRGHTHLAFTVQDVEQVRRCIVESFGLPCTPTIVVREPGGAWDGLCLCYAQDPDGRTLELIEAAPQVPPTA
ncbi:MAG: VOC family protein [Proteobacteria bacterium]|nr:VOC family protein [Pseudomonadota bacterium]